MTAGAGAFPLCLACLPRSPAGERGLSFVQKCSCYDMVRGDHTDPLRVLLVAVEFSGPHFLILSTLAFFTGWKVYFESKEMKDAQVL